MIIQKLIGPSKEVCNEWGMYFRKVDAEGNDVTNYPYDDGDAMFHKMIDGVKESETAAESFPLEIRRGEILSLDTYFNAFSIGKWMKYTKLSNLSLEVVTSGAVEVKAYQTIGKVETERMPQEFSDDKTMYSFLRNKRQEINCLQEVEQFVTEQGQEAVKTTIHFTKLAEEGIYYITMTPCEEEVSLLSGAYVTEAKDKDVNPVELVLGICTFQREEFLKKNVNLVLDKVVNNAMSPLCDHVEIYISDNGQTVPQDTFQSDKVHLFPSKNAGGAGGFTRTMIESLFYRQDSPFTHIILMDDDIILSTDVLERTYHFLQFVDEEHHDMMVGGEMFMLNLRYKQFEAGARWRGTQVTFYNKMWDLRRQECVAANECENPINYSGWWYSVIPTSIITEDNLPIPLFIHYDDMEYGVRNEKNGTILLNGICVWHPQGINKAATRMTYYDIRNMLIGMAGSETCATAGDVIHHLSNRIVGALNRYRYEDAEIIYEAIDDFYKGPDFFKTLDPLEKHAALTKYNYKYEELSAYDLTEDMVEENGFHSHYLAWSVWAIIRWILPSTRALKVAGLRDSGIAFGAKNVFHYDEEKRKGYMTEKSYARGWKDFCAYCKMVKTIRKNHDAMMQQWAEAKKELTSLGYWEQYLGL